VCTVDACYYTERRKEEEPLDKRIPAEMYVRFLILNVLTPLGASIQNADSRRHWRRRRRRVLWQQKEEEEEEHDNYIYVWVCVYVYVKELLSLLLLFVLWLFCCDGALYSFEIKKKGVCCLLFNLQTDRRTCLNQMNRHCIVGQLIDYLKQTWFK
jgi:hypothetical protein